MTENQTALPSTVISAIFICLLIGTLYISKQVDHFAAVAIFLVCSLLLLSDRFNKIDLRKKRKNTHL
ncbi:hypothetical protein NBRC116188_10720 [Oceaniserpentilla sp. 4NH20-0058]